MPPYQPPQSPYQPPQMPAPPQQPPQAGPPGQYDFIMQASNNQRAPGFGPNGQPNKLVMVGAGVIALVIIVVLAVLLFGGGGSSNPTLDKIVHQQAELARVANEHYDDLTDETSRALAINTYLSMSSAQADFTTYLGQSGVKVSTVPTAADQAASAHTDSRLSTAQSNDDLDQTTTEVLQQELQQYQGSLRQAYASSQSPDSRARLQALYDQAGLLLQQAQQ